MAARFSPMFARWRRGRVHAAALAALLRCMPATATAIDRIGSRLARTRAGE
jgi:hypothetical protein